jgi:iron complex transport system substrate-binding protein
MLIGDLDQRSKETSVNIDFTVYAGGISYRGAHGITSTIPEYAPFEFIHIKNLAHNLNSVNNNVQIDKEQLVQWDPDKIFVDYAGLSIVLEELNEDVLKKTLSAIKNNDVYVLLPCNWYTTNFETLFVNAYYSGKVLFPDQFSDISMEKKANEIYKLFLNTKGLYGSVKERIGKPGKIDFLVNEQ